MKQIKTGKQRIDWIDVAKGIAILLVIVGHTTGQGGASCIARSLIFSFHMPLFFTLSCITYNQSATQPEFVQKLKRSFRHLIQPALILIGIAIFIECYNNYSLAFSLDYWKEKIFTLIFASGVSLEYYENQVKALGTLWFLFALFIGRTLLDYIQLCVREDAVKIIVFISCCIGVLFGSVQWLPFSLDIALAVLPFMFYGCIIKKDKYKLPFENKVYFWIFVWLSTLVLEYPNWKNWTYMELAGRRYPMFPICYLTAIAGINTICIFSKWYTTKCVRKLSLIRYIGEHSMTIYFVHTMDYLWWRHWDISSKCIINMVMRIVLDILVFGFIEGIEYLYIKVKEKQVLTH